MGKALKRWWPLFMLPTCLAFMIGFVIPFIQGFYLSFCQFIIISNAHFVGIENYVRALSDPQFSTSFFFTVAFAFLSTVLINVIALAIAQALTRKALKGTNIFRTIFFMPNLIGGIVLGYIWQILINCLLSNVGAQLIALNSAAGFWGLIILTLWQQVGYMMIIYIAGLQSIFDQNLALTGGAPAHSTEMLALNIYNTFYSRAGIAWQGIGQAKAVIFCILVVAISMIQLKATRSKEVQQ
ncbi:MAG: sugar ABC transporter permease [Collinsella sp.]|nr:sugar ABC transporter permease [Collinsella sp.]